MAGIHSKLVELGKHYAERHPVLAKPLHKFQVDFLRFVARINQNKQIGHLPTLKHIRLNHLAQLLAAFLASLGIAISREIDDIPLLVDYEMGDDGVLRRKKKIQMYSERSLLNLMSIVLPGVDEVFANEPLPVSILMSDDLPTFERPIKAYSGLSPAGHLRTSLLLISNSALLIIIGLTVIDFILQR